MKNVKTFTMLLIATILFSFQQKKSLVNSKTIEESVFIPSITLFVQYQLGVTESQKESFRNTYRGIHGNFEIMICGNSETWEISNTLTNEGNGTVDGVLDGPDTVNPDVVTENFTLVFSITILQGGLEFNCN